MKHHVLLCYKDFADDSNVSHAGLGISGAYTAKTLRQNGIYAEAMPIKGADVLANYIEKMERTKQPVTHVVIMAPWIASKHIALLVRKYYHIKFAVNCHSGVGFLAAEPPAVKLMREYIDLETGVSNFHASVNNHRLAYALRHMYGRPITYLPNLYYLHGDEPIHKPKYKGGTLRIGCFGSLRPQKNFSTCIAAAIELTKRMKCHSQIWMNSGRHDGNGNVVYRAAVEWTKNLPDVTLKELHWATWPEFKRVVSSMDINLQVSYTETFNNVTADSIVEGVPCVVSEAIEWAPESWKAEPDDSSDVAGVARRLLYDPHASQDGYDALKTYVSKGIPYWKKFLK